MKRRILSIMFALALVVGISLIMAAPALANGGDTWYVDPSGTDDPFHGTGPGTSAFLTIGYALTQATSGDTINVAAGTYEENITLKDGVSLYGAGAGSSIIDGTDSGSVVIASGIGAGTTLDGFTITNGGTINGGGLRNTNGTVMTVSHCTFSYNEADYGAGMYNHTNCSPTVVDCLFVGNLAATYGGGIYNGSYSSPTVTNCIFVENDAIQGGGVVNQDHCNAVLTNCTFYNNTVSSTACAVLSMSNSNAVLTNCILWDDTGEAAADGTSSNTTNYCDTYGFALPGTANISADPSFVDADNDNFRLDSDSPCIDVGNNGAVPGGITTDFYGDPRIVDGNGDTTDTVDMGAAEYQSSLTEVWVDDDYCDGCGNDGHTWGTDAFAVIQDGINAVDSPGTVHVAAGTYIENITLRDGVEVLGAGEGDNPDVNSIINGGGSGSVVTANGISTSTTLDGFTITNGSGYNDGGNTYGGGMYITNSSSSLTVSNCTFDGNTADEGGGIYNYLNSSPTLSSCTFTANTTYVGGGMANTENSNPTLTNCTFTGNEADWGGGMSNSNSSPELTGCDFTGNTADNMGGGMFNWASSAVLTECDFTSNSAGVDGGGIYNEEASPTVTNCSFTSNTADINGGAIHNNLNSSPTVTICDFISNDALWNGGGIYNYDSSSPTVTNCYFYDNSAVEMGGGVASYTSSAPTLTNCIFQANVATHYGGGVGSSGAPATVVNCTFYGNEADWGGGIFSMDSNSVVENCIVAQNQANIGGGGIYFTGGAPAIDYNDVWGNTPDNYSGGAVGANDISADPLFIDTAVYNFSLQGNSPCVDAGDNDAVPGGVTTDIMGNPRFLDGNGNGTATVDMGAFETVAQVWVDDDYCDVCDNDGHTWGFDAFDNIQDGVDAVAFGGTVNVHPGSYAEAVIIVDKSVAVISVSGDWHDTSVGPADWSFTLTGEGASPFSGVVAISGFTTDGNIVGVYVPYGLTAGSALGVSNCFISGSSLAGVDAGGYLDGYIFIDDCIITNNDGGSSRGIRLQTVGSTVTITDSVIGAYWDATTSTDYAGNTGNGIEISAIDVTGGVLIANNKIVANGGHGITDGISGLAGWLTITDNVIGAYDYDLTSADGDCGGNGGTAVLIDSWGPGGILTVEGNLIAQNYAGIVIDTPIFGECLIDNNYVGSWTQYIDVGGGGGVYCHTFTGNEAYGIAVNTVAPNASLTIINNKIAQNATDSAEAALAINDSAGDTVISANHVGAWTQDIPGGVPVIYEGNNCTGIFIMDASGGSLLILDNTVVGNTEPKSGIHIESVAEGVDAHVNLNDILDNDGDGVYFGYGGSGFLDTLDAINNWWGATDGPGGEGPGSGDEVSTHVAYEPWLGITVDNARAGVITDGALDNVAAAGVEVVVAGSATVTSANYSSNPGSGFSGDIGKYIDVCLNDPSAVTSIQIKLYYTGAEIAGLDESTLRLSWWNGTAWVACSDSGVNTEDSGGYSGYIWANITADTTPTLEQLTGSVFGGSVEAPPSGPQIPYSDTNAPRIANVMTCYDGVSQTTADICWQTSEPATSQVEYWASSSLLSPLDISYVTEHHVQLTDLTPGTTYYFQAMSEDRAGNLAISDVYSFTTSGEAPAAVFTSSDFSVSPTEVESGQEVTVAVLVTNSGDLAGSYELTLEINGVAEETRKITLDAGAGQSVSFTVSKEATGSYSVAIDSLSGSFTVTEPASSPDGDETLREDESSANWPLIWGIIGGVVVIALIVFLVTMRRRET